MLFTALFTSFASALPTYPPVPNTMHPITWRDDFVCYAKNVQNTPHDTLFASDNSTTHLLQSLYTASTLAGISHFDPVDNEQFATGLGWIPENIRARAFDFDTPLASTEALWLEDETHVVLTIPGTNIEGISDFATDALFFQTPFATGGKVHTGFLNSANDLMPYVTKLAASLSHKKEFVVIGHSLGAGIATLVSRMLIETPESKNLDFKGLYLLGSPRVGDAAFAAEFNKKFVRPDFSLVRAVNSNDFASVLPPFGYQHIAGLVYFDKQGNFYEGSEAERRMGAFVFPPPSVQSWFDNHMPYSYAEVIGRLVYKKNLCL